MLELSVQYRRNADTRLRQLERDYLRDPTLDNLLALNRERLRSGMAYQSVAIAPLHMVYQHVTRTLEPWYWPSTIMRIQFPGIEVRRNLTDPNYVALPDKAQFDAADAILIRIIPEILDMGWAVLYQRCGIVTLRIVRNRDYDEWIVQWVEKGKVDEEKSYYTDDREDAQQTLEHMLEHAPRPWANLFLVPQTVLAPSGWPINCNQARSMTLVADQWRKDTDPNALTDARLRKGNYPSAIVLFKNDRQGQGTEPINYSTHVYYEPYDEGVRPGCEHGHYDLSKAEGYTDYLVRLLKLDDKCDYRLYSGLLND